MAVIESNSAYQGQLNKGEINVLNVETGQGIHFDWAWL
jgi:hypothetical protein